MRTFPQLRALWRGSRAALGAVAAAAPLGFAVGTSASATRQKKFLACQSDAQAQRARYLAGEHAGSDKVLAAKYDLYDGVLIDPADVPRDPAAFRRKLQSSLEAWTDMKKRGIWLEIGIGSADLIPIATEEFGFEFHHAERRHIMLTRWLPKDAPNTLPANASHTVGVGCVVTDAQGRLLLVQERSGPAARMGIWKIPTGLVDAGEEFHDAAVREVKEETGVDATFDFMGAFSVSHIGNPAHRGKSNVFFIVRCSAKSGVIKTQENEIRSAKFFTKEEWEKLDFPEKGFLFHFLNQSALSADARIEAEHMKKSPTRPGSQWVYFPVPKPAR